MPGLPGGPLSLAASGAAWAVSTPHSAATDAAADAFEAGGNAIDAAIAAATMLAVAYPHMCGVGGDLIALVRDPSGKVRAVISAGAAPRGIDVEAVRRRHAGRMPVHGPDPITVPGAVAGWEALYRMGASLPWNAALAPAIAAARAGVPVAEDLAATLAAEPARLSSDPGLAGVYFGGGAALGAGDMLVQPELASTLGLIARDGAEAMYSGEVGERYAAGLREVGCTLAAEDLREHRAELAPPISRGFADRRLLSAPPPSQGFVLLQIMAALERLGLGPDPLGDDAGAVATVFSAASAGRDENLADPASMRLSVQSLLAEPTLRELARRARPKATGDTIALTTADADGWAVSLIQSLYDGFGSGILEPNTGIVAHDRGACFTLEQGHPNVLAPGKRPAHTLMPVMVERDDSVVAVAGTMGGEAQPQINAQNLLRLLAMGMSPQDALGAPRWSVEATAATLEDDVPERVAEAIARAGFTPERVGRHEGSLGHSSLIAIHAEGFSAAADPRSDGSARAG